MQTPKNQAKFQWTAPLRGGNDGPMLQRSIAARREFAMLVFAARRIIQAIPILFGVSLVVFGLVHIVPGNPIDLLMPPEASPAVIAQMKAAFGFDQPLYVQYLLWLGRALRGDFGLSVFNATPVWGQLLTSLGNTFRSSSSLPGSASRWALSAAFSPHRPMDDGRTSYSPPSPPPVSACPTTGAPSSSCSPARC
jgi:hypothetical protein